MTLANSQHLLWRLITAPEGIERALEEDPRDAALLASTVAGGVEPRAGEGGGKVTRLDAVRRLGVYAEAYFARIHDALKSDFSDLAQQLGEATFHDLVTSYLAICPPQHPSLREVGAPLPAFLAREAGGEPFRRRAPWSPDLAQLEWTQADLFDAPDAPVVLARAHFDALPPEEWGATRLRLVPATALLALDWPVHRLSESWPDANAKQPQSGESTERVRAIEPEPTQMFVWRSSETVSYRPLEAIEAQALARLAPGAHFGEVCEIAAGVSSEGEAAGRAAGWLARWLADGILAAADPERC